MATVSDIQALRDACSTTGNCTAYNEWYTAASASARTTFVHDLTALIAGVCIVAVAILVPLVLLRTKRAGGLAAHVLFITGATTLLVVSASLGLIGGMRAAYLFCSTSTCGPLLTDVPVIAFGGGLVLGLAILLFLLHRRETIVAHITRVRPETQQTLAALVLAALIVAGSIGLSASLRTYGTARYAIDHAVGRTF